MNKPITARLPLAGFALLSALTLVLCLGLAARASARIAPSGSEERTAQREERGARREQEKAQRVQEREARSNSRAEERASEHQAAASGTPLSGAGTGAAGAVAGARADQGCRLSMAASAPRIIAGEAASLSGMLECPSATTAAGQQISIYERQGGLGGRSYSLVETVDAEADGSYELTTTPLTLNTIFQARVGRHHAHAAVRVTPLVTIAATPVALASSADEHAHARSRATFTGTVNPIVSGARVALQIAYAASGGRWRSVAFSHVGADGSYALAHAFRTAGPVSVRTIVHDGRSSAVAVSETLAFEAEQTENSALTIGTSAAPLVYEQTATISGVGPASSPIELLARTSGGGFTALAKADTDASGAYSFPVTPLQSTSYRVRAGAVSSRTLFEGVVLMPSALLTPSAAVTGEELTFTGTLAGASAGQVVELERENAGGVGFHAIASGSVDGASQFTIVHAFDRPGSALLRVKVPGSGHFQASTSAVFTTNVDN